MCLGYQHLNELPFQKIKYVVPQNDLFAPAEVIKEDTLTVPCHNTVESALGGSYKKKKFQLFQKKCYTAFGSPNNMTLCYLPLLWGNLVLTEVVNKLISISFLGRIS